MTTTAETTNALYDIATHMHAYRQRGFSVIPLNGKKPCVRSWKPWQTIRASTTQVNEWARRFPRMNVGIITGALSSIVVADADTADAVAELEARLPITPTVLTTQGRHYYFAHPGYHVTTRTAVLSGVDVRGDGGYVVAPPSIHPTTGMVYEWLPGRSLDDVPLAPFPEWLHAPARSTSAPSQSSATSPLTVRPVQLETERMWALLEGSRTGNALPGQLTIPEGERNATLFRIGGKMRRSGYPTDEVPVELHRINQLGCQPPLPHDEVERVVAGVSRFAPGDTRSRLRWLREVLTRTPIPGRRALTLRRVYDAHLDIATCLGRMTYTASVRQIAETAHAHRNTVVKRQNELRRAGLLVLVKPGAGPRASTWRVPHDALTKLRTLAMPEREP